jgi:hypothetical protein
MASAAQTPIAGQANRAPIRTGPDTSSDFGKSISGATINIPRAFLHTQLKIARA